MVSINQFFRRGIFVGEIFFVRENYSSGKIFVRKILIILQTKIITHIVIIKVAIILNNSLSYLII